MSREPSDATKLRTAKSELSSAKTALAASEKLAHEYRARATKAEQQVSEWKARFDILLRREGNTP